MNKFLNLLFVAAFISFAPVAGFSQNICVQLFDTVGVVQQIKSLDVPIFENHIHGKTIPSILVNNESYVKLESVLKKTLGIVVTHQTGHGNDHGLLRLGDFFIDRDLPGNRARGEINITGIAWAGVNDYVDYAYRKGSNYNRIEVLFDLTEDQYQTAQAYQKMRRAGTVRPDFTYGNDTNPKDANNRLKNGGEICFTFSCGSAANYQVRDMETQLQNLIGTMDLQDLMSQSKVQDFLKHAKNQLLNVNLTAADLNPNMFMKTTGAIDVAQTLDMKVNNSKLDSLLNFFMKTPGSKEIARILKLQVTDPNFNEILNWMVGISLTKQYAGLMQALEISQSNDFSNVESSKAVAVLIYDANTTSQHFLSTDYSSDGAFSTYTHH